MSNNYKMRNLNNLQFASLIRIIATVINEIFKRF